MDPTLADPAVVASPPLVDVIDPSEGKDGPFCSGHTWILDDQDPPQVKLLALGGTDRGTTNNPAACTNSPGMSPCGLDKGYWFDPLQPSASAWSDDPGDLPEGNWYPSVIRYLNGTDFVPIAFGGSGQVGSGCDPEHQYDHWWTLPTLNSAWNTEDDAAGYDWHQYPRTFLLSTGDVFSASHGAIICEIPMQNATHQWGGNPMRKVVFPAHDSFDGPDPNPPPASLPCIPPQEYPVEPGGLNYSNAVILHTLQDTSAWNELDPVSEYDLDRVIVSGGNREWGHDDPFAVQNYKEQYAQPFTMELDVPAGTWTYKACPPRPRIYGNFVLLPDGSILAVGGAERKTGSGASDGFHFVPGRFEPGGPAGLGQWRDMAQRPIVGEDPMVGPYATPRGYHSVAILLQDGRVALTGGQLHGFPYVNANSQDSLEIYRPPYTFWQERLQITSTSGDMQYGVPYCITVSDPSRVAYACLMGVGSVTHHFDYDQRYIELMAIEDAVACGPNGVKVMPPPLPAMAPEGYYLLFVLEVRPGNVLVPSSRGEFVKLGF